MGTLLQLSKNLRPLKSRKEIERMAFGVLKRLESFIIDLNQLQLSNDQNIFGASLGVYSPKTEEIAKTQNTRQPKIAGQPYNFEWTGELFDGMYIIFTTNTADIFSRDPKAAFIEDKYGDIFGLTEEHKTELVTQKVLPLLTELIWQRLQLGT